MMKNMQNLYPIKIFLEQYSIKQINSVYIKYASKQIYDKEVPTIFFALIQNFYVNSEKRHIQYFVHQIQSHLSSCQQVQDIYNSGLQLLSALKQLIESINKSSDEYLSNLKAVFYNKKSLFLNFLDWFFGNYSIQKCLETFAYKYGKHFIIYHLKQNQSNKEYKSLNVTQSFSAINKIHLFLQNQKKHILYQYSNQQFDAIMRSQNNYFKCLNMEEIKNAKLQVQNNNLKQKILKQEQKQKQQINKLKSRVKRLQQQNNKLQNDKDKLIKKYQTLKIQKERKQQNLKREWENQRKKNKQLRMQIQQLKSVKSSIMQIEQQCPTNLNNLNSCIPNPNTSQDSQYFQNFCVSVCGDQSGFKKCLTCLEQTIPYQIYDCQNHFVCSECNIGYVETLIKNNQLPKCNVCGIQLKSQGGQRLVLMLKQAKRQDLVQQISIKLYKIHQKQNLFQCPSCQQFIQIDENIKFINHCSKSYCRQCMNQHTSDTRCSELDLINNLKFLDRPSICPTCFALYAKDENCDHLQCKPCKQKNLQPEGYCALCCVLRDPIKCHDNSYHRTDCKYYNKPDQKPNKPSEKCTQCKAKGNICDRPTENLKDFMKRHYTQKFINQFYQQRKKFQ